ncbi:hypothetical protein DNTS_011098 [Danionella cerebrum]|uniref:FK506-binding protein 15-like domain-containing protein n=1 Tax=Danionella cerebrum TaxID=2873325 RepID=A0A553RP16_9TELE|nr:hypothetical protein DNTS_011098 [Danionella translucida]
MSSRSSRRNAAEKILSRSLSVSLSLSSEVPLRAKSSSLSEPLHNPDATKAKLISRMAKMGQPMLPFIPGPSSSPSQADSSDSELEASAGVSGFPVESVGETKHWCSLNLSCLQDPSVSRRKMSSAASASPQPVHISSGPPPSVQAASLLPVAMAAAHPQPLMPGPVHAFQPVSQMFPSQTVPYQAPSDVTSFLMTEARQHNTEIRLAVGKVGDKLEHLSSRIDDLQKQSSVSLGFSNVSMETSMIMHNIQRIIQENECLKKEVFEKSSRIEEQNRKIGELLNQNQSCVEQRNLLMEQRNDSLKSSSEQTQARILQTEQEKVGMVVRVLWSTQIGLASHCSILISSEPEVLTAFFSQPSLSQEQSLDQVRLSEDMASLTTRVAALHLELSSAQQKNTSLQNKLSAAQLEEQQHCTQISTLEAQVLELKETADTARSQYRTEKQKRKEVELKLNNMEEELQDMRTEKDNLERLHCHYQLTQDELGASSPEALPSLSERKRKWQLERQRGEEELEELRRTSQEEMDRLRSQLRRARTGTDQASAEQLAQLQADLEQEWQLKLEQAAAAERQKQSRETAELREERDTLQSTLSQLQEKFDALKQPRDSGEARQELQFCRDKIKKLQMCVASPLDFTSHHLQWRRSTELVFCCCYCVFQCRELEQSVLMLKQEERRLSQLQAETSTEVKRVMNAVFQSLREEFEVGESYSGAAVLQVLLSTIKNVTLKLLSEQGRSSPEHPEERPGLRMNGQGDGEESTSEGEEDVNVCTQDESEESGVQHSDITSRRAASSTLSEDEVTSEQLYDDGGAQEVTSEQLHDDGGAQEVTSEQLHDDGGAQEVTSEQLHDDGGAQEVTSEQFHDDGGAQEVTSEQLHDDGGAQEVTSEQLHDDGGAQEVTSEQLHDDGGAQEVTSQLPEQEVMLMDDPKTAHMFFGGPPENPPPLPTELSPSSPMPAAPDHDSLTSFLMLLTWFPLLVSSCLRTSWSLQTLQTDHPHSHLSAAVLGAFNSSASSAKDQEEEEEELSLKGRPPPAPLFGDNDEDEEDLDWLS